MGTALGSASPAAASGGERYDAVLLVSFGGPEGVEDVMPFLENVTAGRGVPPERIAAVAEQYYHFGGVSPLNEQCRKLRAALAAHVDDAGYDLPVYWGNRNWKPLLDDVMAELAEDGRRRVLAITTSPYSSLELPTVPGGHSLSPGLSGARRSGSRQSEGLLRPPWLRGALR